MFVKYLMSKNYKLNVDRGFIRIEHECYTKIYSKVCDVNKLEYLAVKMIRAICSTLPTMTD